MRKFDFNGISIISLRKGNPPNCVFTLMLVYRKKAMSLDEFSRMFEYLFVAYSVAAIARDLSYNLAKVLSNKLLDCMTGYTLILE